MIGATKTGEYWRTIEMLSKITGTNQQSIMEMLYFLYDSQYDNKDLKSMADLILRNQKECKKTSLNLNGVDFEGLETALKEFDENGIRAECGKWSVVRSAYDKQFEIHYEGYTVLDCVADMLSGGYRPNNQWNEQAEQKLKEIVANAYGLELHKTISSIDELKEAIENFGWNVYESGFGRKGYVEWELSKYSPAGEDFSFPVEHQNNPAMAVKAIRDYAYNFDTEEHIKLWVEAQDNISGVPSIRELVDDADAIQEMLDELSDFCSELEIEHKNEYEYEKE